MEIESGGVGVNGGGDSVGEGRRGRIGFGGTLRVGEFVLEGSDPLVGLPKLELNLGDLDEQLLVLR